MGIKKIIKMTNTSRSNAALGNITGATKLKPAPKGVKAKGHDGCYVNGWK